MSDIFQEIDEDLRRDRLMQIWRRYGTAVIALGVGLAVGVAAYITWRNHTDAKLDSQAVAMADAADLLGNGQYDAAAKSYVALAEDSDGAYADLALLDAAAASFEAGDAAGAVALYDKVAARATDGSLRALARVLAVQALMDSAAPADLDARLDAVGEQAGFAPMVRELRAYVRLREGATEAARGLLGELVDDATAPARLKNRAKEVLDALGGRLPAEAPVTPGQATPGQPTSGQPTSDQPSESEGPRP
ncbi:tetratricopeptide repeat protein [Zavarzinia compransoris]|uniref:tetratricopeptide repeat protein n=1 Tax=Zavarzinia marina TaxID=2911065 RepID=UPI001F32C9E7|nr:tetratricopeptide repeat protein [Zavarzinia marina]MCF4164956.1 tetratricopeptide repeat protein [Zavarzinia marina]